MGYLSLNIMDCLVSGVYHRCPIIFWLMGRPGQEKTNYMLLKVEIRPSFEGVVTGGTPL